MMQIGINAQLLSRETGYRRAGIHQYIWQILRYLPWPFAEMRYVVFAQAETAVPPHPGITTIPTRWPTQKPPIRILWEQLVWPRLVWRQQIDLLHSMAFVTPLLTPAPTVVTVYDLSFIHYPERFPTLQRLYLQTQTRRSCRWAQRIITISQSSRQDVHQQFGVPLSRIDVVYPGVDKVYRPLSPHEISKFRQQNNLPERFILHVGTLQPRKNIPVLLKAFARLRDPDLHLFLVGGKGWLYDDIFAQVEALQLTDRVHFTGYVPDETLPFWYNTALALVFPSVYEGFGMPVIEAMACGTPVIAANTSSLPEAAGSAALLFTPHNPEELADRIDTVLHNSGIWATMREQGWQQAQKFSWERAGRETAEIYQRALREL